jgi:hypothetical protein
MAYNDDKKPEPHYTVQVRVIEVTPEYRTGTGTQATTHQRETDEVVNMTVRGEDQSDAIGQAIALLRTADGQ